MFFLKLIGIAATAQLITATRHRTARRCAPPARRTSTRQKNLVEVAGDSGFNTLVAAVQAAGLVETLRGSGPFTVFAPTDKAFAKLPKGTLEDLLKPENKNQLVDILTYHVVAGRVTADEAFGLKAAVTLQGDALKIRAKKKTLKINDVTVTTTNVKASNGIIHVIDTVLLPPSE